MNPSSDVSVEILGTLEQILLSELRLIYWILKPILIAMVFLLFCRSWCWPSWTPDPVKTRPVLVVPVPCVVRPSMCRLCVASTRLCGCCAPEPVRPPSGTSRPLPSAWLMSWSTPPRWVGIGGADEGVELMVLSNAGRWSMQRKVSLLDQIKLSGPILGAVNAVPNFFGC